MDVSSFSTKTVIYYLPLPTAEGLTVTSKVELLSSQSWTVPSLAGTRLYLRDRKNIMALELGAMKSLAAQVAELRD